MIMNFIAKMNNYMKRNTKECSGSDPVNLLILGLGLYKEPDYNRA